MTLCVASAAWAELTSRQRAAGWDSDDLEAWRTIAALFGEGVDAVADWAPLVTAARTAEDRREASWRAQTDADKRHKVGLRLAAIIRIRHALELKAILAGQMPRHVTPTRKAA